MTRNSLRTVVSGLSTGGLSTTGLSSALAQQPDDGQQVLNIKARGLQSGVGDHTTLFAALASEAAVTGIPLHVPAGFVLNLEHFQVPDGLREIRAYGATLQHTGDNNDLFSFASPTSGIVFRCRVRGGTFKAKQSATNPTRAVVFIQEAEHCVLEDVHLQAGSSSTTALSANRYAQYAVYFKGRQNHASYYNILQNCVIRGASVAGWYVDGWDTAYTPAATNVSNQNYSLHNRIFDNAVGMYAFSGGGNIVTDTDLESNVGVGLQIGDKAYNWLFHGVRCEENQNGNNSLDQISIDNDPGTSNLGYQTHVYLGVIGSPLTSSMEDYFALLWKANDIYWAAKLHARTSLNLEPAATGTQILTSRLKAHATNHRAFYVTGAGQWVYGPADDSADATEVGYQRYAGGNAFGPGANSIGRFDGGLCIPQLGHSPPVDADFPVVRNGMICLDNTGAMYRRSGGTWGLV